MIEYITRKDALKAQMVGNYNVDQGSWALPNSQQFIGQWLFGMLTSLSIINSGFTNKMGHLLLLI